MKFATAFTVAALSAPLFEGSAQTPSTETSSNWSLSVGTDISHLDLRTRDPGVDARFIGTLTRSWATRFEKLRLNAELMGGLDAPRGFRDRDGTLCGGCEVNTSRRFASAGVGATFHLLRKSRFNPYVTAGTGIYHNRSGAQSPLDCSNSTCNARSNPFYFWQRNTTSFGLHGGAGVSFQLGGREFFLQQSAHAFDVRQGMIISPLSIGIRF